ncbi:MAG: hypothetical protein ACRC2T_05450, partial [Thermoguttaceae bacterium]
HTGHGMKYDTTSGASGFGTFYVGGSGTFRLTDYINKTGTTVNCYDQASAVFMLGRILGIEVKYAYMSRLGYIKTVNLVGVGNCNNPFYENGTAINSKIVGADLLSPNRTGFSNHAFAMLGENVYDACALTLGISFSNYLTTAIDTSTTAESAVAGTLADRVFGNITLAFP